MRLDDPSLGRLTRSRRDLLRAALGAGAAAAVSAAIGNTQPTTRPLVLAHRGCCARRPEHTLGAYALAIAEGADFVEPDLVVTRDGHLVARHENNIVGTTDVALRPEFAARKTVKTVDGRVQEGWFTEDFTLAELRSLRARERLDGMREESRRHDGEWGIPTFEELVVAVAAESAAQGRVVGLIPELKHPSYFARRGLPLEPRLASALKSSTYLSRCPLIVQSFEVAPLRGLRRELAAYRHLRLMQLIGEPSARPWDAKFVGGGRTYAEMVAAEGLAEIATYADYVAPATRMLIPLDADGRLAPETGLVEAAHAAGLLVGTWTFRPENRFLAADFRDGAAPEARNERGSIAEMQRYLATGIDALFTDDTALGVAAVQRRSATMA
jgi:glycerophosphoryl diester phosphodiesterase